MVAVPNLSGLSKTSAAAAITNAGLIPIDGGSTTTNNSALNNIVASQLPNAGELVPYESEVTYIWYNYVEVPAPVVGGPEPVGTTPVGGVTCTDSYSAWTTQCGETTYCDGTTLVWAIQCVDFRIKTTTCSDGTVTETVEQCCATSQITATYPNDPSCGYVPPTCTQGAIVSQGDCLYDGGVGGYFRVVTRSNSDCTTYTQYEPCSPSSPVVVGSEPVVVGSEPVVVGSEPVVVGSEPVVVGSEPVVVGASCDPGSACDAITDFNSCTTDVYLYDSNCNCVYGYTINAC